MHPSWAVDGLSRSCVMLGFWTSHSKPGFFFFWDGYYINKEKAPKVQVQRWKNSKNQKHMGPEHPNKPGKENYKMRLCQSKALSSSTEGVGHGNDPEIIERGGWRCTFGESPNANKLWTFHCDLENPIIVWSPRPLTLQEENFMRKLARFVDDPSPALTNLRTVKRRKLQTAMLIIIYNCRWGY